VIPTFSERPESISKAARTLAYLRKRVEHERIVWKQSDGVTDACADSQQTRASDLKFNIISSAGLRRVRFHRRSPRGQNFRRGNINEHQRNVTWLGFGRNRVKEKLINRVSRRSSQFLQATETSKPRGISHNSSQLGVVGVLILNQTWRKHDAWSHTAQNASQFDGVSGADFEVSITIEFNEFNRCTEKRCGFFCLGHSLLGRAVSSGFAARTNDKIRRASGASLPRNHTAATEFDVIGMRAEGQ